MQSFGSTNNLGVSLSSIGKTRLFHIVHPYHASAAIGWLPASQIYLLLLKLYNALYGCLLLILTLVLCVF